MPTSETKWVRRSLADARKSAARSLDRLREASRRPVDMSDIPEQTMQGSGESHRIRKASVTLRIDADVLAYFKRGGRGYQTRINQVLRHALAGKRSIKEQLRETAGRLEQLAGQIRE